MQRGLQLLISHLHYKLKCGIVSICSAWSTAAMVENYIDRPGVAQLFEIGWGVAGLLAVSAAEKAIVAGKLIREIEIPRECVVAAVNCHTHGQLRENCRISSENPG
jgi:Trk K+ transport system NAD-binding subunit